VSHHRRSSSHSRPRQWQGVSSSFFLFCCTVDGDWPARKDLLGSAHNRPSFFSVDMQIHVSKILNVSENVLHHAEQFSSQNMF
jgi:hypothetical protein